MKNKAQVKAMQKALRISDVDFKKQLLHYDKTGQVLNRAVAMAKGLIWWGDSSEKTQQN